MNFFRKLSIERAGQTDARHGLESAEEWLIAELGPRPRLAPAENAEHGELVRVLGERTRIEELQEDVARADDERAGYAPVLLYTIGLVIAVGVELLGAILIMRVLGVQPSERLPLGLALALALVGLTAVTAHRATGSPRVEGSLGTRVVDGAKRSIWTLVILAAYVAMIVAIAIVRIQSSTDDETSQAGIIGQALLMLATGIGPAWSIEWLIRRRRPVAASEKRARLLRRRLREVERTHHRAQSAVTRIARDGARWDSEAARLRAIYVTRHRLANAKGST